MGSDDHQNVNENPWLENRAIIASMAYADAHWKSMLANKWPDTQPGDALLLLHFRKTFPSLSVGMLSEWDLKNDMVKQTWRRFLNSHETWAQARGVPMVEEWNSITLLRGESSGSYDEQNNVMIVPRLQFRCIELAREDEGLNDDVRTEGLIECARTHKQALEDALSAGSSTVSLDALSALDALPLPSYDVLRFSLASFAVKKATQSPEPAVAARATELVGKWKTSMLLRKLSRRATAAASRTCQNGCTGARILDGVTVDGLQQALTVALDALEFKAAGVAAVQQLHAMGGRASSDAAPETDTTVSAAATAATDSIAIATDSENSNGDDAVHSSKCDHWPRTMSRQCTPPCSVGLMRRSRIRRWRAIHATDHTRRTEQSGTESIDSSHGSCSHDRARRAPY